MSSNAVTVATPNDPGDPSSHLAILTVDDFAEWRSTVRRILLDHPEWDIVAEACDGCEAVNKATALRPDIVILDIGLPGMNGIEAGRLIRQLVPRTTIVFLSENNDADVQQAALSIGQAFVLKSHAGSDLLPAIASCGCVV